MLSNILTLLLTLLAIELAPSQPITFLSGFLVILICAGTLALLLGQKRWLFGKNREKVCLLELFTCAVTIFYAVGVPTSWVGPLFLLYYFIALAAGHTKQTVRFLLPFIIPFISLSFLGLLLIPLIGENLFFPISLALLALILVFFPPVLQKYWQCQPLPESELKVRLNHLCRKYKFRNGGLLIWSILKSSPTAAIIGVLPRFRYVLFTEPLLRIFSEEEVEAVFAHEMGHAVHHHLLIYPFLLLALPLIGSLVYPYILPFHPFIQFCLYALITVIYIRFVIGYFSRNFEKQADLFIFSVGLSSEPLVSSLMRISQLNFLPLKKRNWHHGSLQERIDNVMQAEKNPNLIRRHRLKLHFSLACYVILATIGILYGSNHL